MKEEVSKVEQTLKDIIEYGFAENVEEELLEFNESGQLVKISTGGRTVGLEKPGASLEDDETA